MEFTDPQLSFSDFSLWDSLDIQGLPSGYAIEECNGSWPQLGDEWSFQTYFPDLTNESSISKTVDIENTTSDVAFNAGKPGDQDSLSWNLLKQGDHSNLSEVNDNIRRTVEQCLSDSSFSSTNTPLLSTYDATTQFEIPTSTTKGNRIGSKSTYMTTRNTFILPKHQVSDEHLYHDRHALQSSRKAHWNTPHKEIQQTQSPRKRRKTDNEEWSLGSPLSYTASTTDSSIASQVETTPIFSPIGESPFHFTGQNEEDQGIPDNIHDKNISDLAEQFYNDFAINWDALDMDTEPGQQWNRDHQELNSHSPEAPETSTSDELTPLEMPDGTIRFTTNWLPVSTGEDFMDGSSPLEVSGVGSFRY